MRHCAGGLRAWDYKGIKMKRRAFITDSAKVGAGVILGGVGVQIFGKEQVNKVSAESSQNGANLALTNNAKANYDTLFGKVGAPDSAESGINVAISDAEFIENYANFAFDEIFEKSKHIDLQTRLKLILGALIAVGGKIEFENMLKAALSNSVSAIEIKEIIYQATAYVGMGRSLEFLDVANKLFVALNIPLPLERQGTTTQQNRYEKGLAAQRAIFGEAIDMGNANAPAHLKHIRTFLSANCFGDYYTRNGLDLAFRELLTFVILSAFGGADAQVKAHAQGNLNMGRTREFLIEVITALIPYIGYPRALNAISAIESVVESNLKK